MSKNIDEVINKHFNNMFEELVAEYNLKYGDISPSQQWELDEIKIDLNNILNAYVLQNMEANNE
jgi:hypothetical protein